MRPNQRSPTPGSLAQWQCIRLQIGRLGVQVTQGHYFHQSSEGQ
ncbi:hypothetical protein PROFUN_00166 [Planoprotostelium fungivorum]|uniref:Uncharacterized protein n=1 Tax=Planoprotostelium fungivorum TaxID=1890364 RepID=A0A2P6P0U5_9EUKA|nr:hypothetical protein PROFUN_00166 [Planoprotostelium fungivorum]